jgi:hypothetical protein
MMIGVVGWGVIFAVILLWEGAALVTSIDNWPSLSDILRIATRPVLGRWALFALWLWVGWHLFVRGWRPFLRDLPMLPPARQGRTRPVPGVLALPSGLDRLLRGDVIPLLVLYLLIVGLLVYCARELRREEGRSPRVSDLSITTATPVWPRLLSLIATTAAAGYALFLLAIGVYYGAVIKQPGTFLEAVTGGGFLDFGIAVPGFVLLSAGQRFGERARARHRPRRHRAKTRQL